MKRRSIKQIVGKVGQVKPDVKNNLTTHTLYPAYRPCGMTERVGRLFARPSSPRDVAPLSSSRKVFIRDIRGAFGGFTLIELLVVVLIIGILAAIAVPQYQKAVERSKAAQALAIIRSVAAAQENYYLANGTYATNFNELAVDIPWTGNTRWIAGDSPTAGTRSNDDWSVQIYREASGKGITVGRLSGPYAGAGFWYLLDKADFHFPTHTMLCNENHFVGQGSIIFGKKKGDYCQKIMKGTYLEDNIWQL